MALIKTHTKTIPGFTGELICTEACYKVVRIAGTKQHLEIVVAVTHAGEHLDTKQYSFAPSMEGENFIKQAYEHLKSLPEFVGAVDC